MLRDSALYPVLLGLIAWGAIVSCVVHRDLFLVAVPYSVASLFFFSCWVRPDARYLVGFHLFCAALLVEGVLGTLDLLRRLAGSGNLALARFLGVSFAILQLGGTLLASRLGPPLGVATWICAGVGAIAAVAATSWPQRRIARFAAPTLGLALFALAMPWLRSLHQPWWLRRHPRLRRRRRLLLPSQRPRHRSLHQRRLTQRPSGSLANRRARSWWFVRP